MTKNTFRLWDETGFNYMIDTDATRDDFVDAMTYVEENVDNYDNESIIERLKELGFTVRVHDEVEDENTFYWG